MMNNTKKQTEQFKPPVMSDKECATRLAKGYKQSFDEKCLITWDEMERRLNSLFERKRAYNA
jgi:hypothetical protein